MKDMKCSIVSSEERQEFNDVKSVTLPAFSGEMQILPDHAENFISLQKGEIILETDKTKTLPIESGVCHVKNNTVVILL